MCLVFWVAVVGDILTTVKNTYYSLQFRFTGRPRETPDFKSQVILLIYVHSRLYCPRACIDVARSEAGLARSRGGN